MIECVLYTIGFIMSIIFFACLFYGTVRHFKSMIVGKHETLSVSIVFISMLLLLFFILGLTILSIDFVFKSLMFPVKNDRAVAATLTAVAITALTMLVTLFGVLYTSSQNRIQTIHSESSWRKMALELEQEKSYTIGSLIKLNSLLNPYKEPDISDFPPIDLSVNKLIVAILKNHQIEEIGLNDFKQYGEFEKLGEQLYEHIPQKYRKSYRKKKQKIPPLYRKLLTHEFKNKAKKNRKNKSTMKKLYSSIKTFTLKFFRKNNTDKLNSELTLFDYKIDDNIADEKLDPVENQMVRACVHALLKADWDNVTK